MKQDTFDFFKGIVLLILTSLLVMAYTTIERKIGPSSNNAIREVLPASTPAAVSLLLAPGKDDESSRAVQRDYVLVKHQWAGMHSGAKSITNTRFRLLFL